MPGQYLDIGKGQAVKLLSSRYLLKFGVHGGRSCQTLYHFQVASVSIFLSLMIGELPQVSWSWLQLVILHFNDGAFQVWFLLTLQHMEVTKLCLCGSSI
jgi:hypothetical protein